MASDHARWKTLRQLDDWLESPMLALSAVWVAIVLIELTSGPSPPLTTIDTVIWILFLLEFGLRLTLAPAKLSFLKTNWLTAIALLAPALRLFAIFRFLRAASALRGHRLVRIVGTANRSMNALRRTLERGAAPAATASAAPGAPPSTPSPAGHVPPPTDDRRR
jgi:voltage-gated potassium channel